MKARPIPHAIQGTPAWLEARLDLIGSSDIPIITGHSSYTSTLALWAEKSRLIGPAVFDATTSERLSLGLALEPVIAAAYTTRTGRKLRRVRRTYASVGTPWAAASLDRVTASKAEQKRIVELKWWPHRTPVSSERVPADIQDQVQWQLYVMGLEVADVVILTGGNIEVEEIVADADYQQALVVLASRFREQVAIGAPPPPDASEQTRRALARMHPDDDAVLIAGSPPWDLLATQLRRQVALADEAVEHRDRLKNDARLLLEVHAGVVGDGYRFTYKTGRPRRQVDHKGALEAIIEAWRLSLPVDRRDAHDGMLEAILATYTTDRPGVRTLRTMFTEKIEEV